MVNLEFCDDWSVFLTVDVTLPLSDFFFLPFLIFVLVLAFHDCLIFSASAAAPDDSTSTRSKAFMDCFMKRYPRFSCSFCTPDNMHGMDKVKPASVFSESFQGSRCSNTLARFVNDELTSDTSTDSV
ncbi:unnamed protein product [Ixodes pacificus]